MITEVQADPNSLYTDMHICCVKLNDMSPIANMHVGIQRVGICLYLTRTEDLRCIFAMGDISLSLTQVLSYNKYISKWCHSTVEGPKDVCLRSKLGLLEHKRTSHS